MEKYCKPIMNIQYLVINENIGACYKIKCNTPHRNNSYNYLFDDSNENHLWDNEDKLLYSNKYGFRGCDKWHIGIIVNEAPEVNGFVTKDIKGTSASPIFWWNEKLGSDSDYHVMVPGKENYETNPNAS